MTKVNYFLPLLFFLFLVVANAQQEFIQGKLLDAETGEPVVFATIRIREKAIGVISNQDGGFRIPIKFKEMGSSLEISSMGYQKKEVPLVDFEQGEINLIELAPGIVELDEAIVIGKKERRRSARNIVKKAIEALPRNYPQYAFSVTGYYRDYQRDKGEYVNLNEAILEVFDQGFNTLDIKDTKVLMYDYKKNQNFKRDTIADNPYDYKSWRKIIKKAYIPNYGGNEFTILRTHDPIRNYKINAFDFINRLEKDLLRNHSFRKNSYTEMNNELLYVIDFNELFSDVRARGKLYISRRDFAIHKIEYSLYNSRERNKNPKLREQGIRGTLIFEATTEYKRGLDEKMYLNYISFHNTFLLRPPPSFVVDIIHILPRFGAFSIGFNKDLAHNSDVEKSKNYKIRYQGRKLKFKKIEVFKDSVMLFPDMGRIQLDQMMHNLTTANRNKRGLHKILKIEVKNLEDREGNVLNQSVNKELNQFREFFVQRVKTQALPPVHGVFMKKDRPIFEDQPVFKPDNFGDYWMNTPLQKTEQ